MTITQLKKRAADAAKIKKQVEGVLKAVYEKVPSFTGKARLIDKIENLKTTAHNLDWDLQGDLIEEKRGG